MIIKLAKVISCSSEHASNPATNLLQHRSNTSWRCAKPGEMLATVIFQLAEPSCITGLDIGNYRSCVVVVSASTSAEPDNWLPIVNHQFLTHDEAANGKFRDQVEIFTKKDLNPETIKIKFDRVKVTCMQSANLKELFGLSFIVFKTEVVVDLGLDIFGRFKMKHPEEDKNNSSVDDFKEKYLKMINSKKPDYKANLFSKIKETGMNNFSKRQEENKEPMKRPLLEKLEAGKADEVFGTKTQDPTNSPSVNGSKAKDAKVTDLNDKPVARTPFGDIVSAPSPKTAKKDAKEENQRHSTNRRKRSLSPEESSSKENINKKKQSCPDCRDEEDKICQNCGKLPQPRPSPRPERATKKRNIEAQKPTKLFSKLFEDITFSLSGYVNPQRDEIRRKALQMGAKYIADPNTTNKKCTHLICAFKNTPKYQQLKGHSKIVSHTFIEDCFNEKKRFPWRRYALDSKDKAESESEEEILGSSSALKTSNVFEEDTDSDSNY
ncbi:PREDICTED: DNA repair protein XRCC1 [Dufourea novaeangliae]|uniref:DNA repair protein XRCC1 n=1 Tax=Dufourea novaeangliae TaxID=178035 RepID=A0A154PDN9_DUFNO|nr:PREDICTED: DNA repair protein XRCC1 [Dufourea novaeangliae]KZC09504.1 DNA repair protein XRCC1 [Dufourea novaeangliae]